MQLHKAKPAKKKSDRTGSMTARGVATVRLLESSRQEGERAFYDPYAAWFVPPALLERLWDGGKTALEKERARSEKKFPGHRDSIISRIRFFDDQVSRELSLGVQQIAILGAGYDTRAYRIPGIESVRIFELDLPSTQATKNEKVLEFLGALPDHVTYVPVDLSKSGLSEALSRAGFNWECRTLFTMEGLLYYLPPEKVQEILSAIATRAAPGSVILFDHFPRFMVEGENPHPLVQRFRNHVSGVGEPLLFGMPEEGVNAFLEQLGYTNVTDIPASAFARNVLGRTQVRGVLSFARAEVPALQEEGRLPKSQVIL